MQNPSKQVAVVWPGADGLPVQMVNQFIAQLGAPSGLAGSASAPEGVYLLLGTVAPPLVIGVDAAAQAAAMAKIKSVHVQPAGRFFLTRDHAANLASVLTIACAQYDQVAGGQNEE